MESSWEKTKAQSRYHFDTGRMDPRWDTVIHLGRFQGSWQSELDHAVSQSHAINWETRGRRIQMPVMEQPELAEEEYDLTSLGADPKMTVSHINYDLAPVFQRMVDLFSLDHVMARIHVQRFGEMWNLHIDKLHKWCPEDPDKVARYFISLGDWQPGQFWEYGNFHWNRWRAGDITTFDWQNVPHCTANAGRHVRCTLQITGVVTPDTLIFLDKLESQGTYTI